jgi:tetratricopeptide (TPR) repeat protein
MSTSNSTVKRIAWLSTIPHLLLMSGLILLLWRLLFPGKFNLAMIYGALAYLIYSFGSKAIILRHHRRGIALTKARLFREAISQFQSSYEFLSKHSWTDKYRFIIMLDSSAIPYREMALCNIAYGYVQLGDTVKAQGYYQKALEEFPDSDLAKNGLEYLEQEKGR